MRMKLFIDKERGLIIESYEGDLSISDIQKCLHYVWSHPDYSHEFDGIFDLRMATLKFSKEQLFGLVSAISQSENGMRGKAVILVAQPMLAGIAALYADQIKDFHHTEIFCTEESAIKYLKVNESIFDKIHDPAAVIVEFDT